MAYIINSSSSSSGTWRICFLPHGIPIIPPGAGEEDAIAFSTSSSSTYSSPPPPAAAAVDRDSPPPPTTESLASESTCRLTRRELRLDLRRPTARGVDGGCSSEAEPGRSGSWSSSFTGTSMYAWTRRTTRWSGALVDEWWRTGLWSTRAADEDTEARFVEEDVAESPPPGRGTGTRFGVLSCASVLCGVRRS